MSVAMIGPKFYGFDKNGKPLAFGKLYTYQARTNDPKDTYQSEDQVVANTNPVILNGEGYANVYLSGSYKMVLKDSDENEIWSSDPVSSSEPSEWVLCLTANYLSPTSFKVNGNFASQYEPGRRVRIDNNTSEYSYATIRTSVFAAGETTVTIDVPVITTGIVESCISIVGPESRPTDNTLNISTMDDALNATFIKIGDAINLAEYHEGGGGGAMWDAIDINDATLGLTEKAIFAGGIALKLRYEGELNVLQVGILADCTNGTDGTDNTTLIQQARDLKVPLYFPARWSGGYKIEGSVTGRKNDPAWRGDGWRADLPESGTVIYFGGTLQANEGLNSQGKVKISGIPYLSPSPLYLRNLTFDGVDKTGVGIELGVDAEFFGFGEWESIQIRGCGLAVNCNNLFLSSWKNVVIRNNKRGVQIQPNDNVGPDDGYFTTWSWSDCYIGFNDGFGVSLNTPLGNKNFSWRNTSVESNCLTLDKSEGQITSYNARINTYSCYFERTDDTPYYFGYGGVNWLEHEDPHKQETGGVKTESGGFVYRHRGGQMVNSTDKLFDVSTNNQQTFYFERANLDSSHDLYANFDGTYKLSGFNTFGADGLFTFDSVKADTFITGASADKATSLRRTRVYKKSLDGITINSGARINLVTDHADASTGTSTTAECKIYGLTPGGAVQNIFLQYVQSTTGSNESWSVVATNQGGGNYDLTGATLLIAQHFWKTSEMIDI